MQIPPTKTATSNRTRKLCVLNDWKLSSLLKDADKTGLRGYL